MSFVLIHLLICSVVFPSTISSQIDPANEWHILFPKIRDRLISKDEAQAKLKEVEGLLKELFPKIVKSQKDDSLYFPLKGYSPHDIGGKDGSGYNVKDYDFFEGNAHKGHPGHDIFIRDSNQDGLDDRTEKPVEVVAAASGVVVSINFNWETSSPIRGGNYIWIYEPAKRRYYYYAHLSEIFVKVGQIVSGGERLGTVGRTGVKSHSKRSPTHLHFTVHQSTDGYPKPINPYWELVKGIKK